MVAEFKVEGILEFQIEAGESGKATGFIARASVIPVFIELGIGEAGVDVENGNELELVRQADDAPEENAIGSVTGKRAVLIGANERIGIVAEELVVVVEFTEGARADVAGNQAGAFGGIPAQHGEEFVIGLRAGVEELELGSGGLKWGRGGGEGKRQVPTTIWRGENCGTGRGDGVDEEFAVALAVLVAEAKEEILAEAAIELDGGTEAVGETEGAVDCLDNVDIGGGRLRQGDAIGGELRDGLRREIGEDGDVEGNLVIEESDTTADGGAIVSRGSEDEANAGCGVEGI